MTNKNLMDQFGEFVAMSYELARDYMQMELDNDEDPNTILTEFLLPVCMDYDKNFYDTVMDTFKRVSEEIELARFDYSPKTTLEEMLAYYLLDAVHTYEIAEYMEVHDLSEFEARKIQDLADDMLNSCFEDHDFKLLYTLSPAFDDPDWLLQPFRTLENTNNTFSSENNVFKGNFGGNLAS